MKSAKRIVSALDEMMRSIIERSTMHAQGSVAIEALLFHLERLRDIATESGDGAGIRRFGEISVTVKEIVRSRA